MVRVFVIEDDAIILKTVELKLAKEGFEVSCFDNGKDAMSAIKSNPPDLILTDVMLPYTSGLEITSYVKSLEGEKIPVIVLSSMGQEKSVEQAFKLGADDYITKPFSLNELAIRIKKQIKV